MGRFSPFPPRQMAAFGGGEELWQRNTELIPRRLQVCFNTRSESLAVVRKRFVEGPEILDV